MKKLLLLIATVTLLTSCYNTRVFVGNVKPKDPVVEVNSEWNHHLIVGLVPLANANVSPAEYLDGAQNYVVKTNTSFLNYIVSFVTFGIYTPTQTKFYIPLKDTPNSTNQKK